MEVHVDDRKPRAGSLGGDREPLYGAILWLARMWTNQQSQFQQEVPMKDRIKWLGVGVGVMYGMQLMILLIIHNFISTSAPPEFSNLLATVI